MFFTKDTIKNIKKTGKVYSVSGKNIEAIIGVEEFKALVSSDRFNPENFVVISILDPDSKITTEYEISKFKDGLAVRFWDIEDSIGRYKTIPEEVAKEIAKFILKNKKEKFIIHCEAGISRSAGTGLAVDAIIDYFGDKYTAAQYPSKIKSHNRYSPNFTVYNKILEEFSKLSKDNSLRCKSCNSRFNEDMLISAKIKEVDSNVCPHCFCEYIIKHS